MDLQKEREAFENHLKKMGKTDNETFSKNEDDSYQMDIIHFGWKIWQAAKARMEVRINTLDEILLNQGEALAQAKAQAAQEWINVDDRLPPVDETVLVCWDYAPDIEPEKEYTTLDENLDGYWPNCQDEPPTHWMPLPKVVKTQEPTND